MKTLSVAQTRRDFCSLAMDVIESGDSVIVSRYGKPALMLVKYTPERASEERIHDPAAVAPSREPKRIRCEDTPMFGMWADREDMKDPRAWIESMRAKRRERWS